MTMISGNIPSEWELWACAQEAVRQHGLDAPIFAAMRADDLMDKGDLDGAATWRLIMRRADELIATPAGQPH